MKFIFSITLIIISGVLFFSIVNPLYGDVTNLRTQIATYNTALDNSTQLEKTRDNLVNTYKNISQEDRDRLEHFLPNTVNNIKFILEIERIANIHSMPIENIKFDPQQVQDNSTNTTTSTNPNNTIISTANGQDSKPYGVFPIEFTTQGDYNTFTLFLKDVEHNLRLVDVKSVSFTVPDPKTAPPGTNTNSYTYSLKIETYWLK